MDEEQVPRTWIGAEVGIFWTGRKDPDSLVLLDVVPEGIVLELKRTSEHRGKAYEATSHILAPWHAITSVQKLVGMKEIDVQTEGAE
jgi:hypothetical protein